MDGLEFYREVLGSFLHDLSSMPLLKISKANKGVFSIPYKTLLGLISSYGNDNNIVSRANKLLKEIDNCLKKNNEADVKEKKNALLSFIKEDKVVDLIWICLGESVYKGDNTFTSILNHYTKKKKENDKKRKLVPNSTNVVDVQEDTSPLISQKKCSVYDTVPCDLQCKMVLKSNQWSFVKGIFSDVNSVVLLMSSVLYDSVKQAFKKKPNNYINVSDFFGLSTNSISLLRLILSRQVLYYLNESLMVKRLSELLYVSSATSGNVDVEQFVTKYIYRIQTIDTSILSTIFPIAFANDVDIFLRKFSNIVRNSRVLTNVLIEDDIIDSYNNRDICFTKFDYDNIDNSKTSAGASARIFDRIKQILNNSILNSLVKGYLLNQKLRFSSFLVSNDMYKNLSSYVPFSDDFYNALSRIFNMCIVIVNSKKVYLPHLKYVVYLYHDNANGVKLLSLNSNVIHRTTKSYDELLQNFTKWEPVFAEVWNHFKETGTHVPPIEWLKDNKGIKVSNVSFLTSEYKEYIAKMTDRNSSEYQRYSKYDKKISNTTLSELEKTEKNLGVVSKTKKGSSKNDNMKLVEHNVYMIQYRDAFEFVKRQQNNQTKLHNITTYRDRSIIDLLYYMDFKSIFKMVCENSNHGVYCNGVSPMFSPFGEFSNETMVKWNTIVGRFQENIIGYCSRCGIVNHKDVYDNSIDPVSLTTVGYKWKEIPMFNYKTIFSYNLNETEVCLVVASIFKECLLISQHLTHQLTHQLTYPTNFQYTNGINNDSSAFFDKLLDVKIPVYSRTYDELTKKAKLDSFVSSKDMHLHAPDNTSFVDNALKFMKHFFYSNGPFIVFINNVIDINWSRVVYSTYMNFNLTFAPLISDWDNCSNVDVDNMLSLLVSAACSIDMRFGINVDTFKFWKRNLVNTSRYKQIDKLPQVPCVININSRYVDSTRGILQSYDAYSGTWKAYVSNIRNSDITKSNGNTKKNLIQVSLRNGEFTVDEDDRVLPAYVIVDLNKIIEDTGVSLTNQLGCAKSKCSAEEYLVWFDGVNKPFKLNRKTHFKWRDGVWIEKKEIEETDLGNVSDKKVYVEDKTYDKSYNNKGSNTLTNNYKPIHKDALSPNDTNSDLPDYVREDENICKLMDKKNSSSLYEFINYTNANLTNEEIYGLYNQAIKKLGSYDCEYTKVLSCVLDIIWEYILEERISINAASVLNKLSCDTSELKSKLIRHLYPFIDQ